jgi:hypothetical protein
MSRPKSLNPDWEICLDLKISAFLDSLSRSRPPGFHKCHYLWACRNFHEYLHTDSTCLGGRTLSEDPDWQPSDFLFGYKLSTIIFSFPFPRTRPGAKKISFRISWRKVCSRKCVFGFRGKIPRNLFSLFLCMSVCLSVYLSVCLSISMSLSTSLSLSFSLSLSLSISLSLSFSLYLSHSLSLSLSLSFNHSIVCSFVRLSIHSSFFLSFPLFLVSNSSFK